jgi:hypothetical protein
METIVLVALIFFVVGLGIGYGLYVPIYWRYRASATARYNRRWQRWRNKQPNCSMCDKVADGYCWQPPDKKTKMWFCSYHFLGTHQPVENTWPKQFTCEHQAGTGVKR